VSPDGDIFLSDLIDQLLENRQPVVRSNHDYLNNEDTLNSTTSFHTSWETLFGNTHFNGVNRSI